MVLSHLIQLQLSPSPEEGLSWGHLKPRSFIDPSQSPFKFTGQQWLGHQIHFPKMLISDVTPQPLPWVVAFLHGMKELSWVLH